MANPLTPKSPQYLPSCLSIQTEPGTIPVSDFLAKLVESFDTEQPVPFEFSHARIRCIEFRKVKNGVQHEFLLVFITTDGRPWRDAPLGIIKCERHIPESHDTRSAHVKSVKAHVTLKDRTAPQVDPAPESGVDVDVNARAATDAAPTPFFSLKAGGLKADPYIPAADRFIYYTPSQFGLLASPANDTIYRHEYEAPPAIVGELDPNAAASEAQDEPPPWSRTSNVSPMLYHLAAIAIVVHERWPEYILFWRQCYWYAAVLYHALGGQDERVETSAENITIEDAFCPVPERGLPRVDLADIARRPKRTLFSFNRDKSGSFYSIFRLVTRRGVEKLYHEENLAVAIEAQVAVVYSTLRAKVLKIRGQKTNDQLQEQLRRERAEAAKTLEAAREATAKAREAERAAEARVLEAERAAVARQLEAERAAGAREREAERVAKAKELEAVAAAVAKEKEAQDVKAAKEREAQQAAAAKQLHAEISQRMAAKAEARERQEAMSARYKEKEEEIAALKEQQATLQSQLAAALERMDASGGAATSHRVANSE